MGIKEQRLQELDMEIKKRLNEEFCELPNDVKVFDSILDQRISDHIKLFLKEIKNISLISVTAAPFSLMILSSGLNIDRALLVFSFIIFMFNVVILNIGVWFVNNKFFQSTASQKLENLSMDQSASDVNNNSLETDKRVSALSDFLKSKSKLNSKRKIEPYNHINIVDGIRFLGIILLSLAIIFLIASIVWPILVDFYNSLLF